MEFILIHPDDNLSAIVKVLNEAHGTIADEFGFTRETNPTNNAFIDEQTLCSQLTTGIKLYQFTINKKPVGCIAIEKSVKETDTFYIEKVSVLPEYRHCGHGLTLMEFASSKIREQGGKRISIALIDSNSRLKKWYSQQGFCETGTKDFPQLPFRVCFMNKEI
jgi:diamine N-acetyltransferase